MAFKFALLSFEFKNFKDHCFNVLEEWDFAHDDPPKSGEGIQSVVHAAFQEIRECFAGGISGTFRFGQTQLMNVNNVLHVGSTCFFSQVQHNDGTEGSTGTTLICKFYKLDENFKVNIELEELISSSINYDGQDIYTYGFGPKQIGRAKSLLDERFNLDGRIECLPVIRRGRVHFPHFLVSSDDRLLEYDFDQLVFHQKSEYQDIKIAHSPSLGNVLLLDDLQNLAEVDFEYFYTLMDRGNISYKGKEILILGGGDGGLLHELLKENPKMVTMAEIDEVVINACIEHMRPFGECMRQKEGSNYEIIIDDCMKVLRQSIKDGKKYDVIFSDLTDIPVAKRPESLTAFDTSAVQKDNPWHFIESIFNLSLGCLKEDGLYMNRATGKGNIKSIKAYEDFLADSKVKVEWETRSSYVPSFMEIWTFYTIRKKKVQ